MFVKPKEGVNVRDPEKVAAPHIPAEGCNVPESSYWLRRIRSGDVVRMDGAPTPVVQPDHQIPDSTESAQVEE